MDRSEASPHVQQLVDRTAPPQNTRRGGASIELQRRLRADGAAGAVRASVVGRRRRRRGRGGTDPLRGVGRSGVQGRRHGRVRRGPLRIEPRVQPEIRQGTGQDTQGVRPRPVSHECDPAERDTVRIEARGRTGAEGGRVPLPSRRRFHRAFRVFPIPAGNEAEGRGLLRRRCRRPGAMVRKSHGRSGAERSNVPKYSEVEASEIVPLPSGCHEGG
mmetsp:Transcript_22120/g.65602  ORF Transcript_22120/g.65602 Transcript_22120/m.65602 type:complete len:216 (-) Transcript_22120:569-1216(-)